MNSLEVTFGKYKGKDIDVIHHIDPRYAKWLYTQKILIGDTPIELWLDDNLPESPSFKMPWGKYKELTLVEIQSKDSQYIEWLKRSEIVQKQKYLREALEAFEVSQTTEST